MKKSIDLHTHSTASDGTMSPKELAVFAKENGLAAVALTDHDTVDGVREFCDECERLGIEGISGVEISTKYKTELHIVGLFVDIYDVRFTERLRALKNSRSVRNGEMLKLLQNNGFDIDENDILSQKDGATLENTGRAHIAHVMVEKGYALDTQDAFDRYLKKGAAFYVSRKTCTPEEAIEMIKNAGGIAVLAHPCFISHNRDELCELLKRLKNAGLDAMECYYSEHTAEFKDLCLDLCKEFGLMPGGGSDFHAANKPNVTIGKVCGGIDVPYEVLEKMKIQKGIL